MKHRRLFTAIAVGALIIGTVIGLIMVRTSSSLAAPIESNFRDAADKISIELLEKLQTEGSADFIIKFQTQADLTPAYAMDWDARGDYVYNTLKEVADNTQAPAKAFLDARDLKYQTFIAGNELYVWSGNLMAATELVTLPEVDSIRESRTYNIDPIDTSYNLLKDITWAGDLLAKNLLMTVNSDELDAPEALAWGILDTNADEFWSTFGRQGEGILVANIDTGVQWDHPALDQSFACPGDPSNPDCWADPSNICGGSACDNHGHGTHTMGTMVADDDPSLIYQAGMAPDAHWIACKGCESSSCSDAALNACADWILAPGGDPANRPHIVNNSWGGGGGDTWYLAKVNAWRAAGIYPAFSAGNAGSACSTLGSPGDYQESFGSAAHDVSRNIWIGSSRGPSAFGHDPYTKPNISAPGVNVCSTIPIDSWSCGFTGTSMASPHSAGAVALLWSCNPSMIGQINTTFEALQNTSDTPPAGTCGAPPDGEGNYTFGYGYLNVLEAGNQNCAETWRPGPSVAPFEYYRFDGVFNPVDGWIYFPGGRNGSATHDASIWRYDPVNDDWEDTGCDMNHNAANITAVLIEDDGTGNGEAIYVVGGYDVSTASNINVIQRYYPSQSSCTIQDVTSDPYPDVSPAAQVIGAGGVAEVSGKIYVFGGWESVTPYFSDKTWEFDPLAPAGSRWMEITTAHLNPARAFIQSAAQGGLIYAMGGHISFVGDLQPTDVVQVFDPSNPSAGWQTLAPMPVPSAEGRGFGFDSDTLHGIQQPWMGKLYVAGGGDWPDETAEVMEYDIATNTWNQGFPNLIAARRNQAGVFVPICSSDPEDGLPGMWVFGGRIGTDDPPYGDPEYYPLDCGEADINIDSPPLEAGLFPGNTSTIELMIGNLGNAQLNWAVYELDTNMSSQNSTPFKPVEVLSDSAVSASRMTTSSLGGMEVSQPAQSLNPDAVLWDQPLSMSNQLAYVNQDVPDMSDYSSFLADDFINFEPWEISSIFIPGDLWNGATTLENATAFTWQIFADEMGIPDGDPSGGSNPPLWNLTLTPSDPQVDITNGSGGFPSNVTLNLDSPVILSPGHYWLVFYPTMEFTCCGQYGRQPADTTNGYSGKFINPGGGFGLGTDWQDWAVIGPAQQDIAFRLEGSVTIFNVPWVSEDPVNGNIEPDGSQSVVVTFDSTGMSAGIYYAGLMISSNDPDEPFITLPLTLTVYEAGVSITPPAVAMTGDPGASVIYTLQVANLGDWEDTFDIAASGNTWAVSVLDPVVTIPLGGVAEVSVAVAVPRDIIAGDSDTVTITASSRGFPSVEDSSLLTTTANLHKFQLPIVFK